MAPQQCAGGGRKGRHARAGGAPRGTMVTAAARATMEDVRDDGSVSFGKRKVHYTRPVTKTGGDWGRIGVEEGRGSKGATGGWGRGGRGLGLGKRRRGPGGSGVRV